MQTMNMALMDLVKRGVLSWKVAQQASPTPDELKRMREKNA